MLDALVALADEVDLAGRRDAMYRGDRINVTENRSVLHTALRRPKTDELVVEGQDVISDVHEVLDRMYAFADKVRSGEWRGITGKPIDTIINIGIGGSDLGPVMVYEALKPSVQDGLRCRFISNIDPTDVYEKTADADPETTLFIVASKTFTTLETITNAKMARWWLLNSLRGRDIVTDAASQAQAIAKHFVAVSTALDKVEAFGIDPANAFGFWDWVGGRYSVDSAVGLPVCIAIGPQNFADFLAGFNAIDRHFAETPWAQNVPALMGLLNVWYVNFFGAESHAVLPYAQYLHRFAAYLQQLTMESNGKGVRADGTPVMTATGEIFWGEPGTNGQHAFYQLIHQGTRLIPADFIAVATPAHPISDGRDVHELFSPTSWPRRRRWLGKDRRRGGPGVAEALVSAKVFKGNRPTTSIMVAGADAVGGRPADRAVRTHHVRAGRGLGDRQLRSVGRRARQGAREPDRAGHLVGRLGARRPGRLDPWADRVLPGEPGSLTRPGQDPTMKVQ